MDVLHPIAAELIEMLRTGENGKLFLPEPAAKITALSFELLPVEEIEPALQDCLRLAHVLDTRGSSTAARSILRALEQAVFTIAPKREAAIASPSLARFLGRPRIEPSKEPPPEDAISPGKLAIRRMLR